MELKNSILVITGMFCIVAAPETAGRGLPALNRPAEQSQIILLPELEQNSIEFAQIKPQTIESETRNTGEDIDKTSAPATEKIEDNNNNSTDAGTKSLKPFKPSEEIAAEQAVDFPVDI